MLNIVCTVFCVHALFYFKGLLMGRKVSSVTLGIWLPLFTGINIVDCFMLLTRDLIIFYCSYLKLLQRSALCSALKNM